MGKSLGRIDRFDWTPGDQYKTLFVRVGDVQVDESYHRPVSRPFVEDIKDNFSDELVESLMVNLRPDGQLWLVDGRRHLEAWRELLGDDHLVPAMRYVPAISVREEAERFIKRNCNRRTVSLEEVMAAGQFPDPDAWEEAKFRLNLESARENLSPEDLERARLVAGVTEEEAEEWVWRREKYPPTPPDHPGR